jgi:hypothetical protein
MKESLHIKFNMIKYFIILLYYLDLSIKIQKI